MKNILNRIHQFFFPETPSEKYLVIFDGDQYPSYALNSMNTERTDSKFIWIHTSTIPNYLKKHPRVKTIRTSSLGKEAADTLIGMELMRACMTMKNLKEAHIVSSDYDMFDILINISLDFPHINFHLLSSSKTKMPTKILEYFRNNSRKNVFYLRMVCK